MPNCSSCEAAKQEQARRPIQQAQPGSDDLVWQQHPEVFGNAALLSLLANPRRSGRGNGSLRATSLQRMQQTHGNRAIQRLIQRGSGGLATDEDTASRIESRTGKGERLDPAIRRQLERSLGADLSHVNIHTDPEADYLTRDVNAIAFSAGSDIFFSSGAYNPSSREGMHVLAHEAVHTLQQSSGSVASTPVGGGLAVSDPEDRYEQEAERVANEVPAATTQTNEPGGRASILPAYLQSALHAGTTGAARQRQDLEHFRQEHEDSTLDNYRATMSEAPQSQSAQGGQLTEIRRMGRASQEQPFCFFTRQGAAKTVTGASREDAEKKIDIRYSPTQFCHDGACAHEGGGIEDEQCS